MLHVTDIYLRHAPSMITTPPPPPFLPGKHFFFFFAVTYAEYNFVDFRTLTLSIFFFSSYDLNGLKCHFRINRE